MLGVQTTASHAGCATCKRRGVKCNGTRSDCIRFKKLNGLKLSWPRANDTRRSVVSKASPPSNIQASAPPVSDASFVHTSNWDMELHHSLSSSNPVHGLSRMRVPLPWMPLKLETSDRELIEYFCGVASASLATFGYDATALGNILVRIALHGGTTGAEAVLHALLAFSSLHRYGLQAQAAKLKISALKALNLASAAPSLGPKETIEHTATGMLLCSFEVHISSCSSDEWMAYLAGVETVICASNLDTLVQVDPDFAVLLDWVHYFHVLARFSLLYWERDGTPELPPTPPGFFSSAEISRLPPPIYSMLTLLSQICDTVSSRSIPSPNSDDPDDHKDFIKVLDWRIRSLPIPPPSDSTTDEQTSLTYLYQLSLLLLLLTRHSTPLPDKPLKTHVLIDKAFSNLSQFHSCKPQFPIHVIGCEARTDEHRTVVLDVIARTERLSSPRSFNYTKKILQAVWAQEDLGEGGGMLGYRERLTWVVGHCMIVPAFV